MSEEYRVGNHYGIHVYQGDRPVATFFDADEAAQFVAAMNEASDREERPAHLYGGLQAEEDALGGGPDYLRRAE